MWYEEALKKDTDKKVLSRKELFLYLQAYNESLNYNSYKWILADLISKELIYKIGYDAYSRSKEDFIYRPLYSDKALQLECMIEQEYPLAEFCMFESFLLNEFLNHQIAQNTFVVQVEKELSAFIFDFLDENWEGRTLYKPNKEAYDRYWSEGCIVIVDKISEAPYDKQAPHSIILEKLLVDIFAEPIIRCMFSESEYPLIMETAKDNYHMDLKKMLRYARRRNATEKIKKYMEE